MDAVLDVWFPVVGQVLAVAGGLIFLTAGLGMLKLPDFYTRVSTATTAAGLGVGSVVVGVLLAEPTVPNLVKALVALALQLVTSVVASIAVARSAYLTGAPLAASTRYDELAEDSGGGPAVGADEQGRAVEVEGAERPVR
ncbi:cation:proton antiporter [Kineococcus terrestris]|uniref:cation:proton antiporter n=1 Tax=Kineococcus terrestris TaxID=2044856 RepID=UPI0034DB33A1